MKPIYLDYNATTPIDPEVANAIADCYRAGYANPSSQHQPGRRARQVLEDAREGVAKILGADTATASADRIIFTSGGTEANNLAIRGRLRADGKPCEPGRAIVSAAEHPSVLQPADSLALGGWDVAHLRVSCDCVADVDHLRELLSDDTRLVSVMLGNNETGVLQPVREMAQICSDRGVLMHTDAVQVVGKLPVHFRELGVAAMSVSAHKLHGPRGVGVLVLRHGVTVDPIFFGGHQQAGARPGTESIALAVGMHKALALWQEHAEARAARMAQLRVRLETQLTAEVPEAVINGAAAARLPHTTNVSFPGLNRQSLAMVLDLAGVAVATGSACASGSSQPSPVLLAMGCDRSLIESSIRISLGAMTTDSEVAQAVRRISRTVKDLRTKRAARKSRVRPRQCSS